MENKLIEKYGKESRWVNYKILTVDDKLTKIPFSVNGKKASSIDPKSWSTYEEAKNKSENVGIIFTPEQTLVGIDIDHCLNDKQEVYHQKQNEIKELITAANTYTEVSPSGTGLHLFLELTEPFTPLANKKAPFELYTKGRYFTVTQNIFGEPKEVRTITHDELSHLLSLIGYPWAEAVVSPIKSHSPLSFTDSQVLAKMFGSKNGIQIHKLYEGDVSEHNNDESSADMALCMHLAFWTGKDASQIERLWVASPLGSRKKTQSRKDYRDCTISSCIAKCTKVYEIPEEKKKIIKEAAELDLLYTMTAKGDKVYVQNTENICRILRHHEAFVDRIRYDVFKNVIEIMGHKWRGIEDNDAVNFQTQISVLFPPFAKVIKGMVFDAMIKVAKENAIDSAADFIRSTTWDGVARLDSWLTQVYGAPDDAVHRAMGSNWLKGMVKRIIQPGCKFDYVLVLEGPQGSKKSTSLGILGGDWHVETTMSTDSKDFFMQFQGKAIIEFSEGETLSRTEVKRMKAIITMQSDKYRPPYERTSQDFPRRCVFAMTTNQEEYLKDETGNRRWLPVALQIPQANIEWLQTNRNQLFAEAYHRAINLSENVYDFPDEIAATQNERRITDPNADMVVDWYFNKLSQAQREEGITIFQVYRDAMNGGYVTRQLDKYNEMIIAGTLKDTLGLIKKREMRGTFRTTRWYIKQGTLLISETRSEVEQIMDGVGF